MEKGRGREGSIVDWMVTRCGKIATVGSHVPRIHVLPRTGTHRSEPDFANELPPLPFPLSPPVDRSTIALPLTRDFGLMERCRLMLCTFRSCFIGFRHAISLEKERVRDIFWG